jgi:hypothetical protein
MNTTAGAAGYGGAGYGPPGPCATDPYLPVWLKTVVFLDVDLNGDHRELGPHHEAIQYVP